MRSASFAGTLNSLWGFRIVNSLGLVTLVVWALQLIGSQALLRITASSPISYMNSNATRTALSSSADNLVYYKYAVDSLFVAVVLNPSAMKSPQDTWTNLNI